MTENHFRSDFSTFQINTQLFFIHFLFSKWPPAAILEVRFGLFWMTKNHFQSLFSLFQINTQRKPFWKFDLRQNTVLPLCVINGYAKYEVDR